MSASVRWLLVTWFVQVGWPGPAVAHADVAEMPVGVVLAVDEGLGLDEATAAARRAGGAQWRGTRLQAARRPARSTPAPSEAVLDEMRSAYLEADFLRCLTRAQRFAPEDVLASGEPARAAALLTFGAACAYGAEETATAERWTRWLLATGLESQAPLEVTSADFQRYVDALRQQLGPARTVRIVTRPERARLRLDGQRRRCSSAPCTARLRPGPHLLQASALGHRTRRLVFEVGETPGLGDQLIVALDPAPAEEVRGQLLEALRGGSRPDDPRWMAAAADAEGARVLLVLWQRDGRLHAAIYDASLGRRAAHASVPRSRGVRAVVLAAIETWRGLVEPRPVWKSPWFWVGTLGTALLTGLVTWAALRPAEKRYDLVVRFR